MKKHIVTIAIVVLLLAGLTGCDDILEIFYPEFGEGSNTIEFRVIVSEEQAAYPVYAEVYINWSDGDVNNPYRSQWAQWNSEFSRFETQFVFDVPNGEYRINVWLDLNGNGWADWDELSTTARRTHAEYDYEWYEENFYVDEDDTNYLTLDDIDFSTMAGRANAVAEFWIDYRVFPNTFSGSVSLGLNAPEGKDISSFNINLNDDWGYWVWNDWGENNNNWASSIPWYAIDNESLTSRYGSWKFSVEVWYTDGTYSSNIYPIAVVNNENEISSSSSWYIDTLEVWGLENEPTFLAWEQTYDVILQVDGSSYLFQGALYNGLIDLSRDSADGSGTTLMNRDFYYHGTSDPYSSCFEVIIDKDNSGTANAGDWISVVPVGLDDYTSWDDGGKRYASFYPEVKSFVPF